MNVYSNITYAQQGPNSKWRVVAANTSGKGNVVSAAYSMPRLIGIPKKEYATLTALTFGSYSAPPSDSLYSQIWIAPTGGSTFAGQVNYVIQCRFFVEFFDRVDVGLLNT